MSEIKTPLDYGQALRMATTLESVHPFDRLEQIRLALVAVDVESRQQAREDVQSGLSPLPPFPPIAVRGCMRCSASPAPLELAAPALQCSAYFCSPACLKAYDIDALLKRWARSQEEDTPEVEA